MRYHSELFRGVQSPAQDPALPVGDHGEAEHLPAGNGLLQFGHRLLGGHAVKPAVVFQPVEIVVPLDLVVVFQHKTAVGLDEMGKDQGVVDAQGEGIVDGVQGHPGQQGGALAAVRHVVALGQGIAHRHPEEQQTFAVGGIGHHHLGVAPVQGGQELVLLPDGHRLPVEHIRLALGVVQGQIFKIPGPGGGGHGPDDGLVDGVHPGGGHRQGDALHLGQLHLHQGIKVPLQLAVDLLHVQVGHLGQGLVAAFHHDPGNGPEHRHTQGGQTDQADPQEGQNPFSRQNKIPPPFFQSYLAPLYSFRGQNGSVHQKGGRVRHGTRPPCEKGKRKKNKRMA